jgi:ribonuclease Z
MKKPALIILLVLIAGLIIAGINLERILTWNLERMVKKQIVLADTWPEGDGIRLITVGSGFNGYLRDRTQPCNVILAGGQFLVFDTGGSTARSMKLMNLPLNKMTAVFLTHYHSDHMAGLGAVIERSWMYGPNVRSKPLDIYGPKGIKPVVEGFNLAYRVNTAIRHGIQGSPVEGALGAAHPITLTGKGRTLVYTLEGLHVYAFKVNHHNPLAKSDYEMNAVGYRIEYKGRVIILSGDTVKTENMIRHAEGADILVHEAIDATVRKKVADVLDNLQQKTLADLSGISMAHHTTAQEAAEIAQKAQVKKLVLNHIQHNPGFIPDWFFLKGTDDIFDGEIVIAKDGMDFYLPPVSTEKN